MSNGQHFRWDRQLKVNREKSEAAVFEQSYSELKQIARKVLSGSSRPNQWQPTVLLHEAFLKMPRAGEIDWNGRQHFFSIAARAMRRAVVDQIRHSEAGKRVQARMYVSMDSVDLESPIDSPEKALLLDEILAEFEALDPLRTRVAEMRIFGGMAHEEIALVIGKSTDAAKKDWKVAKVWFRNRLSHSRDSG